MFRMCFKRNFRYTSKQEWGFGFSAVEIRSDDRYPRLILYHVISLFNKELTENGRWVIIRDIKVETEFPEQKQNQSDIRE